ncbi:MAG: transposase, partial [Acidobacteriota bacterium]|nr:transposase [Acidobacteriota bacterium]
TSDVHTCNLHNPARWRLPAEVVGDLGARLHRFWQRFRACFATRTRDSSQLAHDYLRAQLTIERGRNFVNIERLLNGGDGQRLQHFMSNSPWSGPAVFQQIRREIVSTPELDEGGTLILDECADEKAGDDSAGVSRQYNGRMGKVDLCRVDTCLIYANLTRRLRTMVDGELFIASQWFSDEYQPLREQTGIPADRQFATKLALGLQMIERCRASGIRFDIVACDALYGRDQHFRSTLHTAGVTYAAQVPSSTLVFVDEATSARASTAGRREACEVRELARREQTRWRRIALRLQRTRAALGRLRALQGACGGRRSADDSNLRGGVAGDPPSERTAPLLLHADQRPSRDAARTPRGVEHPTLLRRAHVRGCQKRAGVGGVRGAQVARVGTSLGVDGGGAVVRGADQAGVGARMQTRHQNRTGDGCAGTPGAVDGKHPRVDAGGTAAGAAHADRSSTICHRTSGAAGALDWQPLTGTNGAHRLIVM